MKKICFKMLQIFIKTILAIYCKIVYRYKVIGLENIPKEGNIIFCGNHSTYLDPVLIIITSSRDMRFMAKEDLRKMPLYRFLGFVFNVIYVKRDSKDIGPLKDALKTLKSKECNCIGMFPEGTRNGLEKNGGELKDGAAYLALKTGAKILPIGIVGNAKPFKKNVIYYGKPIEVAEYQTKDKEQEKINKEKLTLVLKEEIIKLTNEAI